MANVTEALINDLKPLLGNRTPGSGGSADMSKYLDILETTEGTNTLTWDGNVGDRCSFDLSIMDNSGQMPEGAQVAVKLSNTAPTLEQLNMGASITYVQVRNNGEVDEEEYIIKKFIPYYDIPGLYVCVTGDNDEGNHSLSVLMNDLPDPNGGVIEKGVYVVKVDLDILAGLGCVAFVSSVTFNGYNEFGKKEVIKKEHLSILKKVGSDTIKWDCDFAGRYAFQYNSMNMLCHVSDAVPTLEELKKGGKALIQYENRDMKIHFTANMVTDLEEGADNGEGVYFIAYLFLPLALVATKPGAYFNWEADGEVITVTLEKPGVYFPCMPDATTKSFMIQDYKGFMKHEVKIDHMPHVDGTIVMETFGTPQQAYTWLEENFSTKKIVKISVTNGNGATDYGTYEKVTKETGDGSDGYVDWSGNPITGLSTTYYAFHSIKSGNVNANGTSLEFLHGGLYQHTFYPRKGKMSIGTDGVSWEYDSNATPNKTYINGPGAEDSGFEIAFYCIE